MNTNVIEITGFAKAGGILSKRISLSADGTIKSDGTECIMTAGKAKRVCIPDISHLSKIVGSLASNEAIALGALAPHLPDVVEITTKRKHAELNGTAHPGIIARTGDHIRYRPDQSAFALLDFDSKGMPDEVKDRLKNAGGFGPAILSVIPAMANVARMMRASTSSGLYRADTNEKLPGSNGLHLYITVKSGQDVDRFLRDLHNRCFLAGFGWLMVGAGGQLLERSIVDRMVGAPERLIFEGAPILLSPLMQDADSHSAGPNWQCAGYR